MLKFSSRLWAIAGLMSLSQWSCGFALADSKSAGHDDHHTPVPAAKPAAQVPPPVSPVEVAPHPNVVAPHAGVVINAPVAPKPKVPETPNAYKFGDPAPQIYYPPYTGSPPPGNLGRTYQTRTRLIPEDKHPRTGIVEMRLPENAEITSQGLKATWTGTLWSVESEQPLVPWNQHVYVLRIEQGPEGARTVDYRWVRLIMGRVVEIE